MYKLLILKRGDEVTTGERIKYYRERAGLTMEQLAKKVGVQNSAINKYEKGIVTNIPIERVKKIAAALEVEPADLVEWNDDVDIWGYDKEQNVYTKKRLALREFIDEAPEEMLDIIEWLVTMRPEQLNALMTLTGLKEQDKHS